MPQGEGRGRCEGLGEFEIGDLRTFLNLKNLR